MSKSRYIMIGGFLGAGKTTSILQFARHLSAQGIRVGLITNDQGAGLVDTAVIRSEEFPAEEISGGCFCCRFNSLVDAARQLTTNERPDVFLAEPVGSCTDLVATVSLPLQNIYGDSFRVAAMSVVVDPVRALRIFSADEGGRKFSEHVCYIYRKQLEEAEMIVINKTDMVNANQLARLNDLLSSEYPGTRIFNVSARSGAGLEPWFNAVYESEIASDKFMDIDYDRYGKGESLLGWLNGSISFSDTKELDGNQLLASLAECLGKAVDEAGAEVAHMKMTINPVGNAYEIAALSLVRGGEEAEFSHRLSEPLEDGEILLNMRAESSPELLREIAISAFNEVLGKKLGLDYCVDRLEHFRPGQPVPTYRMTAG
jgi:Ni2+-binding GTPase involved in maturation of urease and hydrogenase